MYEASEFDKLINSRIKKPKLHRLPRLNESTMKMEEEKKYLSKFHIDKVSICRATRL